MTRKYARVIFACVALAACDGAANRDLTAPDDSKPSDATAGTGRHLVVRANGEVFAARAVRGGPSPKRLDVNAGGPVKSAAVTTVCNAGVIAILSTAAPMVVSPAARTATSRFRPARSVCFRA